ncbi:UNVERIFIED_CONTAM: hypothetical protein Sradi_3918000 [Sesamum radiatum]|uniref:Integrase catalytic domain-containing protein n=1 Tax=Sesamum radiatum TaxID=300843 RepID=A0AAW2PJN3_SESRA
MRYKSEAFGRFKEYNLKPRIKLAVIKKLRSDWGGEYLSGEFIVYLKENGILSQWTPRGTLQLNGMAERRKSNPIAHGSIRDKFYRITPSFWGHALETAAKLLHKVPSKTVPQKPYEGFPADSRRDEVLLQEKSGMPQQNDGTSFEPMVFNGSVPILCKLTRESRPPDRYGFLGLTSKFDNDPRTYK